MHFKQQKMKEQSNHENNPYSLHPQITNVPQQKIIELSKLAKKYFALENKFNVQPFFSRQEYYILSSKWLSRWKLYVGYKEINGAVPPNKFLGCGVLPTANQDIVQTLKAGSFEFEDPLYNLNISLKADLQEGKDYTFITKQMYYCLKDCEDYGMIRIPRQVIKTTQGKKVQMYYLKLNIIVLYTSHCKEIQSQKVQKFIEVKCQYSHYSTVRQFNNQLSKYIKRYVQQKKMISFTYEPMKTWLLNEGIQKNIFFNTLKEGCKANNTYQYKIYIDAQLLQNHKDLKDYDINQESYIIAQLRESQNKNWMFFNKNSLYQGTCNYCKMNKSLTILCSCKFAAYCSLSCKIKDKSIHKSRCPNQAQSDAEEQTLTMTPFSKMGKVGLRNLGNTCFMNSGLQCIAHIKEILFYFIQNKYIPQINKQNPLGTQGQLSVCFAKMLQNLWFGSQNSFSPTKLKRAIAKFQPIFQGYSQHDAGQLINYVLDGLHEDLNRIKKKPYLQQKDYDGRPDKIIAKESWQNFQLRNKSIITDLMYGQYKSKVDCPDCQYTSIQFDPFLMFSLPLVNSNQKTFSVIFIKDHIQEIPLQITYSVNKKQKISHLLQSIKLKMNIQKQVALICYKCTYSEIKLIPHDDYIQEYEKEYYTPKIYVRELLKGQNPQQDFQVTLFHTIKSSGYYSTKKISNQKLYFFSKELTYKQVHYKLYSYYKKIYEIANLQNQVINVSDKQKPFKFICKPQYRYKPCAYCGQKECQGCLLRFNDQKFMYDIKTPKQIEMQILWVNNSSQIKDIMQKKQASDDFDKQKDDKKDKITLEDCFKLSAQPQILSEENAWYCPKCKKFVLAKKQMLIYKAPKILILCLKRFKRKQYHSQKLNMFVDYPLQNLDMTKFLIDPELPHKFNGKDSPPEKVIYDLISVCNHMGSTGGGHYTAYCKDVNSSNWFEFDDSSVSSVENPQKQIITKAGYVLFYRRRE